MTPEFEALLAEYEGLVTLEDLRMYLSSVAILKKATGGWGEITLDFKAGETKEARILMTQRSQKKEQKKE